MLTITINQPWAEFVIAGLKPVENRAWKSSYQGVLLIHASRTWDDEWEGKISRHKTLEIAKRYLANRKVRRFGTDNIPTKAIIGAVVMTGCDQTRNNPWCMPGMWYHRYTLATRLTSETMRGRQKLFDVKTTHFSDANRSKIKKLKECSTLMGFDNNFGDSLL